jgi:Undecaprenyl-phosphate galactose phosphotransferase WbaP
LALIVSDLCAVLMSAGSSVLLLGQPHAGLAQSSEGITIGVSVLIAFTAFGLYPLVGISPAQEFRRILWGSSLVYAIISASKIIIGGDNRNQLIRLGFAWSLTFLFVIINRALVRSAFARSSWWGVPTVMFGSGGRARATLRFLERNASIGLKVVAVFDEHPQAPAKGHLHEVSHGSIQEGIAFAMASGIDHAIVALPASQSEKLQETLRYEMNGFKHLLVVPDLKSVSSLWAEPRDLGGILALHVQQTLRHPLSKAVKRFIDVAATSTACLVLLPLFVVLCVASRLSSPGPIFFGHQRIGRNNSSFKAWKFRSMYQNGDEILKRRLAESPEAQREWEQTRKLKRDPRVTPVGRFIRKTSLDELPQLWNVLVGDMSLVGPRPIVTDEIRRYGADYQAYAAVRPGITGLWQISGRNNTSYEERVQFDEYYVRNWSVILDLYIILRTFKTVLASEGAY